MARMAFFTLALALIGCSAASGKAPAHRPAQGEAPDSTAHPKDCLNAAECPDSQVCCRGSSWPMGYCAPADDCPHLPLVCAA